MLLLLKSTPVTSQPGLATLSVSSAGVSVSATSASVTVTLNQVPQ